MLLTNSAATMFLRCQREYYWRHQRCLVSTQERADSLRFGELVHLGLETWWVTRDAGQAMSRVELESTCNPSPVDAVKAKVMIAGYHLRWQDDNLKTLAVEKEFSAPLMDPITGQQLAGCTVAGKLDAVAEDQDGRQWIVEHKTTTADISPGSAYWTRLRIDPQISMYFSGARSLGYEPVGCIYDVLKKPAAKPLGATPQEKRKYTKRGKLYAGQRESDESLDEYWLRLVNEICRSPADYFARNQVVRLEEELYDSAEDTLQTARAILDATSSGRWMRNPSACERYRRMCEYWPICSRIADPNDPQWYKKQRPNNELEGKQWACWTE